MRKIAIVAAATVAAFLVLAAAPANSLLTHFDVGAAYAQPYQPQPDEALQRIAAENTANYAAALPASDTQVVLVKPDQVQEVASALPSVLAAGIFAILLRLVGPFAWVLKVARADQMIEKYAKGIIDEWLDNNPSWKTSGITADVKNAWVASVATQVINFAPAWLIQFLGGKEAILQKVRNRLPDVIKDAFPAVFSAHYVAAAPAAQT